MRNLILLVAALAGCLVFSSNAARADSDPPRAEKYLLEGKLAEGEAALAADLKKNPRDDATRFGLGMVQFLHGVERFAQSLYKYGFGAPPILDMAGFPGSHLPLPKNPQPQKISYAAFRAIAQAWLDDLQKAETTLAGLGDTEIELPLRFGLIRLDLDGDGQATDEELLWKIYVRLNGAAAQLKAEDVREFVIAFDRGDADWLRGYCHLLMALGEIFLAYDGKEWFERTAHLIFPNVETPHEFLYKGPKVFEFNGADIADLIAYIHLLNFPVAEPKRLTAALEHLEAMLKQSRAMWKHILAETDDNREWIPGPKQTGVVPNVKVTDEMVRGWGEFLDEAAALLAGKTLIPFWRAHDGRGINLRRVFTEPRPFDLVLWIQGTAATPYLERGTVTKSEVWERFERIFQGEFVGFALWFN